MGPWWTGSVMGFDLRGSSAIKAFAWYVVKALPSSSESASMLTALTLTLHEVTRTRPAVRHSFPRQGLFDDVNKQLQTECSRIEKLQEPSVLGAGGRLNSSPEMVSWAVDALHRIAFMDRFEHLTRAIAAVRCRRPCRCAPSRARSWSSCRACCRTYCRLSHSEFSSRPPPPLLQLLIPPRARRRTPTACWRRSETPWRRSAPSA